MGQWVVKVPAQGQRRSLWKAKNRLHYMTTIPLLRDDFWKYQDKEIHQHLLMWWYQLGETEAGWTGWGTTGNVVSGLGFGPGRWLVTQPCQKELVMFRKGDGKESTDIKFHFPVCKKALGKIKKWSWIFAVRCFSDPRLAITWTAEENIFTSTVSPAT